jgi:hypothetical protein
MVLLSVLITPLCTFITVLSWVISPYLKVSRHIAHYRKWRRISSSTFKPRNVLLTGVGMSKGLALSRTFYRAGHNIIGADFEPYLIPVSGHFSTTISTFYRLTKPSAQTGSAKYIRDLIDLIKKEKIELWVPCSGEGNTLEDAEAAEAVEKETDCKVIQFGLTLTETLHDKYSFITNTRRVGLNVPETHLVTSETEALVILYPEKSRGMRWVMKSVRLDDAARGSGELVVLPKLSGKETHAEVKRLNPTPFRPFVLQEFINGVEYCSHSLIVAGEIRTFVACPSKELLMHYTPLPTSSALSQAMLLYTTLYAQRTGSSMTGHFSLDFLVDSEVAKVAESRIGVEEREVRELMEHIFPIECNPRVHTAILAFQDVSEDLADAYLSILPKHEPKGISNGHRDDALVVPKPGVEGYYWIGHDLVTKILLPVLKVVKGEMGLKECLQRWMEFLEHVCFWREATYEIWDPWPTWWAYVGYWPLVFLMRLWEGRWWSRVNLATNKIFDC